MRRKLSFQGRLKLSCAALAKIGRPGRPGIKPWRRYFPAQDIVNIYHSIPGFGDVTLASITRCRVLFDLGLWAEKVFGQLLFQLFANALHAVPLAGEGADLAWAPVSALLVNYLYGNSILTGLAFAEEVLPGLDVVPTATIGWLLENTELGRSVNEASAPPPKADAPSSAGKSRGHDADVIDVNGR